MCVFRAQILAIVSNTEMIAANQQWAGSAGDRVWSSGFQDIWAKPQPGGAMAVVILNRDNHVTVEVRVTLQDVGMPRDVTRVGARDMWAHVERGVVRDVAASVPPHGVVCLLLTPPRAP